MKSYTELMKEAKEEFKAWDILRRPGRYLTPNKCSNGCDKDCYCKTKVCSSCYFKAYRLKNKDKINKRQAEIRKSRAKPKEKRYGI